MTASETELTAPTSAATDELPKGWTGAISWNHGNADGLADLVAPGTTLTEGSLRGAIVVGLGDGTGAFPDPTSYLSIDSQEEDGIDALAVGDFDGDGHLDLLLIGPGETKVLFGDGTAQFPRERSIGAAGLAVVAELNGDTRTDAVFCDGVSMTVYLNAL